MKTDLSTLLRDNETADARRDAYIALLQTLQEDVLGSPPSRWWHRACRAMIGWQIRPERIDPDIRDYAVAQSARVLDVLRAHARETRAFPPKDDAGRARRAQDVIHLIAHAIHEEPKATESLTLHRVRYEDIAALAPSLFRHDPDCGVIEVRADTESHWTRVNLPRISQVMYKGGVARVVVKIAAGAGASLLRAELPPNDIDIIACGNRPAATSEAMRLGADAGGIEWMDSFDDLHTLMAGRDLDINQCFLTADALLCTEEALAAGRSGKIHHKAEDRGLYGTEVLYYEGEHLVKNRGVYRLAKFLVEGKARSFDFTRLNEQIDLGIYWLVLVRKLGRKHGAGRLLNRLYELGRRIGQVRAGEETIYDVLDRVHAEYPFFNLDDGALDEPGVAYWLSSKLARLADRVFRQHHAIPIGLELSRSPDDMDAYTVTLDGYVEDAARDQQTTEAWPAFLERCRRRTSSPSH